MFSCERESQENHERILHCFCPHLFFLGRGVFCSRHFNVRSLRFNKSFDLEKRVLVASSDAVKDLDFGHSRWIELFFVFYETKADIELIFIVVSLIAHLNVSSLS